MNFQARKPVRLWYVPGRLYPVQKFPTHIAKFLANRFLDLSFHEKAVRFLSICGIRGGQGFISKR